MRRTFMITAASIFAAGAAFADAHTGMMGDFDADGDAMLNDMEFGEAEGSRRFMSYDADQSGDLNEEEFTLFEDDAADRGLFD